jgi:gliding motility-associated protein GldM
MGHGKETPRQKMIGMMYLVLTALLALNVSKDVLDAFIVVDEGLNKTVNNFADKSGILYAALDAAAIENAEAKKIQAKANQVKTASDKLFHEIDVIKTRLISVADKIELSADTIRNYKLQSKDNQDVGGQVMIVEKGAEKLKEQIIAYREELKTILGDSAVDMQALADLKSALERGLSTDDPTERNSGGALETWEQKNFEHLPLIAVTTIMTKIQTDIRNAEADVVSFLRKQIGANDYRFNKVEAIVLPKSNYIMKGGKYEADVFIAASDSTQVPEIVVNGNKIKVEGGRGKYIGSASSVGEKKWGGVIKLVKPDKTVQTYPFDATYMVGEPSATVSPSKMNVFYVGVNNPVEVLASGVAAEKLRPTISSGSIKAAGGGGKYTVRVKRPGQKVRITVNAEIDGKTTNMGSKEFRVKRVPDPVAKIAGKKGGVIARNILKAQAGVAADLENFDFDLKFIVQSFVVSATVRGYEEEAKSNSYSFTAKQKQLIGKLKPNSKVYITDIKAKGPDGTIRSLPSISFKLK